MKNMRETSGKLYVNGRDRLRTLVTGKDEFLTKLKIVLAANKIKSACIHRRIG